MSLASERLDAILVQPIGDVNENRMRPLHIPFSALFPIRRYLRSEQDFE